MILRTDGRSASSRPRRPTITVAVVAAALALVACGNSGAGAPPAQKPDALQAARDAATRAAGGAKLGGTLNLLGVLGDQQLAAYLGTLKPFEEATGVTIKYESTRDVLAVLQTRIAGGNPPDVVSNPSAGQISQLGGQSKLVPLDSFLDMTAVRADYPAGLLDLASSGGHLYGVFYNSAVQGLVWYDPKNYTGPKTPASWGQVTAWADQTAAGGKTPWCIGLESGPASGWPGAVWIEQFVLQQAGGEVYDQWWQGRLRWTSPAIRTAFENFGRIATDPKQVSGGPTAVLTTSFTNSPHGLVASPPTCQLHVQADFMGNALVQEVPGIKAVDDIDFFAFPPLDPARAGSVEISGEALGLLKDTPQGRALMKYVSTPEFSTLVAGTGQWIAANSKTDLDAYTTPLSRKAAQVYANGKTVRYAAQNAMPPAMSQAFLAAVLAYVKDPSTLDAQLAALEAARLKAYQ
jgi:alpha-glucoside transport system substrate-binding protein